MMQTPNELLPDGLQMDLLWTNASPTSAFGGQTITIPNNNYNHIIVSFKEISYSQENSFVYTIGMKNIKVCMSNVTGSNDVLDGSLALSKRFFTWNGTNEVVFTIGYSGVGTIDINYHVLIPYQIYGVR